MWKVKYWDGSYEPTIFETQAEAVKAARKGLQDWMGDYDYISQSELGTMLQVYNGSEEETDASAKLIYVP